MEQLVQQLIDLVTQLGKTLGDLPGVLFKLVVWNPDWLRLPDWSYLAGVWPFSAVEIFRRIAEVFASAGLVVPRFILSFSFPLIGHYDFIFDFAPLVPVMAVFRACQMVFFVWCFAEEQVRISPALRSAGITI